VNQNNQDVGELLTWTEIHAGTDREVWQWWPGGLLCCVNGLACEVRYSTQDRGATVLGFSSNVPSSSTKSSYSEL
jgi:hypothetical protein